MNAEQLSALPSAFLHSLLKDIQSELRSRKMPSKNSARREFISQLSSRNPQTFEQYRDQMQAWNSKECRSLRHANDPIHLREKYLGALLAQDWSSVFPETSQGGCFYVYAHVDPTQRVCNQPAEAGGCYGGQPFYIGKGCGERAWDLKRNQGHGTRLRQLVAQGWKPEDIVHIAFEGLSENKAFEIESKLIYFFGTVYQLDRKFGCLLNLDVPKTPVFVKEMEKILLRKQFEKELNQ